jgi:hypothetical protein
MLLKEHQYLSICQASKYIGLSIPILSRYEKSGKLICKENTLHTN